MTLPRTLALAGLAFISACASKDGNDGRSELDQHKDSGSGGANTGGSGGTAKGGGGTGGTTLVPSESCVPGAVWKPTSTRIAIRSFGFFEGSMRYEKAAADLTSEQVSALTHLCFINTSSQTGADFTSYSLEVEDADGSVANYRAAQNDIVDSDEGDVTGIRTLSYASLKEFLATFRCKTAKGSGGPPVFVDGGDLPDPASVPGLAADPGCFNGVFFSYPAAKTFLSVPVATPGALRIHAEDCFEMTGLRLFAPQGTEALATSGLVTAPDCPSIEVRVDQAGSYLLEIEKQNIDGASQGRGGDFYVRMSLTP